MDNEYSAFEFIFGKLPSLPGNEDMNHPKIYNFKYYANELKTRLKHIWEVPKNLIELKVGDLVLVRTGNERKHEPPTGGPYEVKYIDDSNVLIKIKTNIKSTHKNILKNYKV